MKYINAVGKELYVNNKTILLRGFGLGGWFLPEGYMWKLYTKCDRPRRMEAMIENLCGEEYAGTFWERYLDYYITEDDIEFIARVGFNCIRLPLNARHLYEMREHRPHWKEAMFARIDRLIAWCRRHHIYVILDMHGAPGGQTGQNIDDSEADQPLLFMVPHYEEELILLWSEIARRYRDEEIVAGYDLLNEPVPNFFQQYNPCVLPLYRKLIQTIRENDRNHMIILEGVHWATDFSIFDPFTTEEAADNILLQFHKYWSNPDAESLQEFIHQADRLNVPLFMGEGGENNCDWYTTVFPLYERLSISWSFWSYKKMDCTNSPITFNVPEGWAELIDWIDGKGAITAVRARVIFDNFLQCLRTVSINSKVLRALKRELPVNIPCEAYEEGQFHSPRVQGAKLRMSEPASIVFESGKSGEVDYRRYGGEEQPVEEKLLLLLGTGDHVNYRYHTSCNEINIVITAEGEGELKLSTGLQEAGLRINGRNKYQACLRVPLEAKNYLLVDCTEGYVKLDDLSLSF
ncbi:MAG: glycoside hydrolase [Firmicutes bacterium]|nr:glycoside hydrolase [Bacillota bacterium]